MTAPLRYRADHIHEFCCPVLEKLSLPRKDAEQVSDCLLQADLRGVDSHGVIRLPVYAGRIQKGVVNPRPKPRIISAHPAAALLKGDNGLGAALGSRAMDI